MSRSRHVDTSDPSVAVYDARAEDWLQRRSRLYGDRLEQFRARLAERPAAGKPVATETAAGEPVATEAAAGEPVAKETATGGPSATEAAAGEPAAGKPVADLGCGPGWHTGGLPQPAVALDASRTMLAMVDAPLRVAADLRALPLRRSSLRGAWASRSYVHLARAEVPLALADLHRALEPDAAVELHLFAGDCEWDENPDDDFPGRRFSRWPVPWLTDVLVGAGFTVEGIEQRKKVLLVAARRRFTLPDTVGTGMGLLVCGLNPSLYAAEAGVGFARPGNRFWPAALAAGVLSRDRDPRHAMIAHGIGMTDLVKRPTRRADELTADEYAKGMARLERLTERLQPGAVCFVGLAGWRAAIDRRATAGPQTRRIGGRPAYLMPSTSGLNANSSLTDLTAHLQTATTLVNSEPR